MESLLCNSLKKINSFLTCPNEISTAYQYCMSLLEKTDTPDPLIPFTESNGQQLCLIRVENFSTHFKNQTGIDISARSQILAEQVFGEAAVLFKDKINFRYPGDTGYAPHQDAAAGWDKFASKFISIAVMLEDSNAHTGGFFFPDQPAPTSFYDNHNGKLSDELFYSLGPQSVEVRTGDAILFDSFTPHKTEPNHSGRIIPHILLTFNRLAEGDYREAYYKNKIESMSQLGDSYEFRVFEFSPTKTEVFNDDSAN